MRDENPAPVCKPCRFVWSVLPFIVAMFFLGFMVRLAISH
jgi:hypothetical protein